MPKNKNAMTRYRILDDLLSNRYHNYSLNDLTEEVNRRIQELEPGNDGVSRRTIESDLYYLENTSPFQIEIERYSVSAFHSERQKAYYKRCLRYKDPSYSIFKKKMSADEQYLLREALSLLGQFDGLPNLEALENLRLSLEVEAPSQKIISFTKNPLGSSNLLGELFTAISQQQVIRIRHHRFDENSPYREYTLYPYLLKEYNRRWYLLGATENAPRIRCFGLERIDSVTPLPSHTYVKYNGCIEEFFEDIIGIANYAEKPVEHILFWVSNESSKYVETSPLHESQIHYRKNKDAALRARYPHLKEGAFFSIDCKKNYELIRELTAYGKELLVLSPLSLQQEIYQRIESMCTSYRQLAGVQPVESPADDIQPT